VGDLLEVMKKIGFGEVECVGKTGVLTTKFTEGALFRARKSA
jgi:hypothetical protein